LIKYGIQDFSSKSKKTLPSGYYNLLK